jgi:hypothetical protein
VELNYDIEMKLPKSLDIVNKNKLYIVLWHLPGARNLTDTCSWVDSIWTKKEEAIKITEGSEWLYHIIEVDLPDLPKSI